MALRRMLKEIRNLHQKKYRLKTRLFLVEGEKSVLEFLHADWQPVRFVATSDWLKNHHDTVTSLHTNLYEVTHEEMTRLSHQVSPPQVLAVFYQRPLTIPPDWKPNGWSLFLDNLQDPGNVGTIVRIADWFGLQTVFCSPHTVEVYNPKVIQASMGSLARVRIYSASATELIRHHPQLYVCGADPNGNQSAFSWHPPGSGLLIIGSESHGIQAELHPLLHTKVAIPRWGAADSLNAAVAAGILCAMLRLRSSSAAL